MYKVLTFVQFWGEGCYEEKKVYCINVRTKDGIKLYWIAGYPYTLFGPTLLYDHYSFLFSLFFNAFRNQHPNVISYLDYESFIT